MEDRVPTLMIRHRQVIHVVDEMLPIPDFDRELDFTEPFEDAQYNWNIYLNSTTIVKDIFQKLHDMFTRYREQKHQSS